MRERDAFVSLYLSGEEEVKRRRARRAKEDDDEVPSEFK